MADYYTNFSIIFSLPDEAAQAYALELHHQARQGNQGDEMPADFPQELMPELKDWHFETDADTEDNKPALWLHSSSGGIDAACSFIKHLLQKFDADGRVTFEWSHDCSKPRTDAYGGGAAIITAKEIKTINTSQWLAENAA